MRAVPVGVFRSMRIIASCAEPFLSQRYDLFACVFSAPIEVGSPIWCRRACVLGKQFLDFT